MYIKTVNNNTNKTTMKNLFLIVSVLLITSGITSMYLTTDVMELIGFGLDNWISEEVYLSQFQLTFVFGLSITVMGILLGIGTLNHYRVNKRVWC